jgi:hypothetical protein
MHEYDELIKGVKRMMPPGTKCHLLVEVCKALGEAKKIREERDALLATIEEIVFPSQGRCNHEQ